MKWAVKKTPFDPANPNDTGTRDGTWLMEVSFMPERSTPIVVWTTEEDRRLIFGCLSSAQRMARVNPEEDGLVSVEEITWTSTN